MGVSGECGIGNGIGNFTARGKSMRLHWGRFLFSALPFFGVNFFGLFGMCFRICFVDCATFLVNFALSLPPQIPYPQPNPTQPSYSSHLLALRPLYITIILSLPHACINRVVVSEESERWCGWFLECDGVMGL